MVARRSLTIKSVRGVLYLLLIIVVFPAMLAHFVQMYRAFHNVREEAIEDNSEFARSIAAVFQTYANEVRYTEQAFGDTYVFAQHYPLSRLNTLLTDIASDNPTWRGICWVNLKGNIEAASRPQMIGRPVPDQPGFRTIASGRGLWAVSGLYRDPLTGRPMFAISQGVRDNNKRLRGVCLVQVDPQRLDKLFTLRLPPGTAFLLVDQHGLLVYQWPQRAVGWEQRNMLGRWPFLTRTLHGEEVTGTMRGIDGVKRIVTATPMPSTGWAAVVSYPEQTVVAPWRQVLLRDIVFFALLFITAFWVGLMVSRYITWPLDQLGQFTGHIARGELDYRVAVGGPTELAALATALNGMAVDLQERTAALDQEQKHAHALAERESRYAETLRVLIETVPAGIIECDREGNFILLNPMAIEMLGQEAVGLNAFGPLNGFQFFKADGTPFPIPEMPLPRALTEGTVTRDLEFRVKCPDGREAILLTSAGPICDDAGNTMGAVAMVQDITPLHQSQEERELFIHTISHDLRLPLSIIQGHAQVLEEEVAESENAGALNAGLKAILRSTSRMNVMIQDLVDSARMAGHTLEMHAEPVEIRSYLDNLLQRAATSLEVERICLEVPDDLPPVRADYARLERILMNLLSNALKYSPPDAPVMVSAHQQVNEVVISVSDHGIGIATEDMPNIFERFYRAHGARKTEGIGLGLYITRLLVEAHAVTSPDGKATVGGRIWVESEPGKGSTFSFTLPLA